MNTRSLILIGLVWVSAIVGWAIWQNEDILAHGRSVRLELAPVDPRSLLQGDYMAPVSYTHLDVYKRQSLFRIAGCQSTAWFCRP